MTDAPNFQIKAAIIEKRSETARLKYWLILLAILFLIFSGSVIYAFLGKAFLCEFWLSLSSGNPAFSKNSTLDSEYVKSALETLKFIATAFGGFAVLFNAFYAAKRSEAMERNNELTEERLITERFSKAIEQLGSDKTDICLGGMFTLEQIAQSSPDKYYWITLEILAAFIREHSHSMKITTQENEKEYQRSYSIEIQTALKIIGVSDRTKYKKRLNLDKAYLQGLDLSGYNLSQISFIGADLSNTTLKEANLTEAILDNVYAKRLNLSGANLSKADLSGASLPWANLSNAKLVGAKLIQAVLVNATLCKADLRGANLNEAYLIGAELENKKNWESVEEYNRIIANQYVDDGPVYLDANCEGAIYDEKTNFGGSINPTSLGMRAEPLLD